MLCYGHNQFVGNGRCAVPKQIRRSQHAAITKVATLGLLPLNLDDLLRPMQDKEDLSFNGFVNNILAEAVNSHKTQLPFSLTSFRTKQVCRFVNLTLSRKVTITEDEKRQRERQMKHTQMSSLLLLMTAVQMGTPTVEKDSANLGVPFERYTTRDKFGRSITFYLSIAKSQENLPLCVFIGGSGGQSVWTKRGDKLYGGQQNLLLEAVKGRGRVMVVEKPGVPFCFQPPRPGTAEGCPEEFLQEHTLPRWAEAVGAAIKAAWTLSAIDVSKTLVVGHSEGGIVAARVAAENPRITHVAILAGGGPTQLFDITQMFGTKEASEKWVDIQKDPDSISKFTWGHPYRRWSSFCASSTMEELLRSKARVYIAQGTEDKSVPIITFDILYTGLLSHKRDVTAERIQDADHSFNLKGETGYKRFAELLRRIADWFWKKD